MFNMLLFMANIGFAKMEPMHGSRVKRAQSKCFKNYEKLLTSFFVVLQGCVKSLGKLYACEKKLAFEMEINEKEYQFSNKD